MKILIILFVCLTIALLISSYFKFKVPKLNSLILITGGVKTGKSTMSVHFVRTEIKRRLIKWFIKTKIFRKKIEKPLVYSNIPLANLPFNCGYVELTDELLQRKKRFAYGSVIYVCEASLVADSQLFRDKDLNERLLMLNKLIGHETHSGILIYDTQSIQDVHFSIKRTLSQYFYIHHLTTFKILPFVVAHVLENRYSEDGTISNTEYDVEDNLKSILMFKKTWKSFDCYCYSYPTDNLPVVTDTIHITNTRKNTHDLRVKRLFTFKEDNYYNEKEK